VDSSIGLWVVVRATGAMARVVEVVNAWSSLSYRVWAPGSSVLSLVPADGVTSCESHLGTAACPPMQSIASAARIADALARDEILAPIESSLIPLPHQFQALARAISSDRIRFLLADEVGLGKTIEAGLILRKLKLRGLVKRTYMVPELLPTILCRIQRPWE